MSNHLFNDCNVCMYVCTYVSNLPAEAAILCLSPISLPYLLADVICIQSMHIIQSAFTRSLAQLPEEHQFVREHQVLSNVSLPTKGQSVCAYVHTYVCVCGDKLALNCTYTHTHSLRIPLCRHLPIDELSVGQFSVIRKLCLLRLTAVLEMYNPNNKIGPSL